MPIGSTRCATAHIQGAAAPCGVQAVSSVKAPAVSPNVIARIRWRALPRRTANQPSSSAATRYMPAIAAPVTP